MLESTFPLMEMLQFLNELQWELTVAKMSFHLQVKILQPIMQLDQKNKGGKWGPNPPRPSWGRQYGKQGHLQHWTDGGSPDSWASEAAMPYRELPAQHWWPRAMSGKGQGRIWPQEKNKFFIKAHLWVNWETPESSRNSMPESIRNENANMPPSPDAVLSPEHRNLPTLFRWVLGNLVFSSFPKWNKGD